MKAVRIGVYRDRGTEKETWCRGENVFTRYIEEILSHAGITFDRLNEISQMEQQPPDVLFVTAAGEPAWEAVLRLADQGGEVMIFGGGPDLARRLGAAAGPAFGPGYAEVSGLKTPLLRFLKGVPWHLPSDSSAAEEGCLRAGSPDGKHSGTLITRFSVGAGWVTRWAIDVPTTVVHLQQGKNPVTADGHPAPDGTADLDEGILKADDGFALDWEWDRSDTETGERYFAHPYADLWRETLLRDLFNRVRVRGWTLPFIDRWPGGVSQVAMISLDSDSNLDESAETTLKLLDECGVCATWCMMEPGYHPSVYSCAVGEGHEMALHYNAFDRDGGSWGEKAFAEQLRWLKEAIGCERVVSNKNHYTRFEGWGELFRWCEKYGMESDQTRGPSKKGNIGFLFGTCHPYFPIARGDEENRFYDVLEIGFLTQDLNLDRLADTSVIVPFLQAVEQVRGVSHFLFHPIHLHREEAVRNALRTVVREAENRGFRFWTGQAINGWERSRRKQRITGVDDQRRPVMTGVPPRDSVVMVPLLRDEEPHEEPVEMRFGVPCRKWLSHQVLVERTLPFP
ncbi:hypothetical protein C8P63_101117 [Melghirimyces profundicolus]|uniref:Uncharacterized protein n=1 Tax=Melghirimyces profundicolus TaxID=1242148 RepID=A0A2T6C984_9BACL|nr:hypothetical protein [Melghirimyces profundicolus]PTX64897.1 hypothetical protein C8P63_101117 [Melghirimyces profundicolus]